jgi:hypothetical protein
MAICPAASKGAGADCGLKWRHKPIQSVNLDVFIALSGFILQRFRLKGMLAPL